MASSIISIESKGNFNHIEGFFKRTKKKNFIECLNYFGQIGVTALAMETPVDTSETAASWDYEIVEDDGKMSLIFTNSSMAGSIPVVILLIYGHATKNGSYVQPYDFVSPVTKELFDKIAASIWEEVTK